MRTMESAISRLPAMQAIGRMGTMVLQPLSAVESSLQGKLQSTTISTPPNHIDIYLICAVNYSMFFSSLMTFV